MAKSRRNFKKYHNPYLPIGTKVQSRYRGRWYGIVEEICDTYDRNHNVVRCRITHDQNHRPMRKTLLSIRLDTYWLRVIDTKGSNEPTS